MRPEDRSSHEDANQRRVPQQARSAATTLKTLGTQQQATPVAPAADTSGTLLKRSRRAANPYIDYRKDNFICNG